MEVKLDMEAAIIILILFGTFFCFKNFQKKLCARSGRISRHLPVAVVFPLFLWSALDTSISGWTMLWLIKVLISYISGSALIGIFMGYMLSEPTEK